MELSLIGSQTSCDICENPTGRFINVIKIKAVDSTVYVCDVCATNLVKFQLIAGIINKE